MNNNTNLHQYFWERFQNEKRFLGFKVTKIGDQLKKQPIGVDGQLGAAIGDFKTLCIHVQFRFLGVGLS